MLQRFRDVRIGARLAAAFVVLGALVALSVGVWGLGSNQQRSVQRHIDRLGTLQTQMFAAKFWLADISGWQGLYVADCATSAGPRNALQPTAYNRSHYLRDRDAIRAWLPTVDARAMTPAERATWQKVGPAWEDYFRSDDGVVRLLRSGRQRDYDAAMKNVNGGAAGDAYDEVLGASDSISSSVTKRMTSAVRSLDALQARTTRLAFSVLVLAALAALGVAVTVSRSITRPLSRCVDALRRVAAGDLTARAGVTGRDEPGQLAASLDATTDRLRELMARVRGTGEDLAAAAGRLDVTAAALATAAASASTQVGAVATSADAVAGEVGSVAAGSDQMQSAISAIATSAAQAAGVASGAADAARTTRERMAEISEASAGISEVVQAIRGISEQTNLLALNATIEAARAGEAGKGFAVVAGEVKDLAQAAARATEDIGARITAMQQVTATAVADISAITGVVQDIDAHSGSIAASVEEQSATTAEVARAVAQASSGVSQISRTVSDLAAAAAATADGAEQARRAAGELAATSGQLTSLVGVFTT